MSQDFVISGGEAAAQVTPSTHDTFDSNKFSNWLANSAGLGIYAHGRVHQEVGAAIYVGDIIHKRGHRTTEDLLLMEEQALQSYGDPLAANSRLGALKALAVLPSMDTANGEGDLIAYYEGGVVAFRTHEAPRETRVSGDGKMITAGWDQKRLINHLLNTVGAVGRYSVATLPRDHFFRSEFGLHFLKTALGEGSFQTEQINVMSMDVRAILDADDSDLLGGAATGHWVRGGRMFATAGMSADAALSATSFGRGFVSWNQAVSYTEDRTPIPAWEGLWVPDSNVGAIHWFGSLGVRSTPGSFGFLCSDSAGELHFATIEEGSSDERDGSPVPIEWSFETGSYHLTGLDNLKTLRGGRLEGLFFEPGSRVRVSVRTDASPAWSTWLEFQPCDESQESGSASLLSQPLGFPPESCKEATWFQIRVEGLGAAEIRTIDLDFSPGIVKSERHSCRVVSTLDSDPFETTKSPASERWTSE